MSGFHLVTNWTFAAPIERVWEILTQTERLHTWWPGFEQSALISGQDGEIGSIVRHRVRGDYGLIFDFTLEVVERREPEYLRLLAVGDLNGSGEWRLRREGEVTSVTYVWDVTPRRRLLRVGGQIPFLRRRMEISHDRVMAGGHDNLVRLLAAQVSPVPPAAEPRPTT